MLKNARPSTTRSVGIKTVGKLERDKKRCTHHDSCQPEQSIENCKLEKFEIGDVEKVFGRTNSDYFRRDAHGCNIATGKTEVR